MSLCPCGSGRPYEECCETYIEGRETAPTAEALMRSRYAAHTLGKDVYKRQAVHIVLFMKPHLTRKRGRKEAEKRNAPQKIRA